MLPGFSGEGEGDRGPFFPFSPGSFAGAMPNDGSDGLWIG